MTKRYFITYNHRSGFSFTFPCNKNGEISRLSAEQSEEYALCKSLKHFDTIESGYREGRMTVSNLAFFDDAGNQITKDEYYANM